MSILEVAGITKRFGGLLAVSDLSFNIEEKQIMSLIGPNGAGKTTTFNMLTNFITPDEGRIIFKGEDVTGIPPHRIAEKGMIRTFQKTNIFPLATVAENISMGAFKLTNCNVLHIFGKTKKFKAEEKRVQDKIDEVMDFFKLNDVKNILATNLSYGQKRILEMAIAMACEPELLMLDEPVAGLNPSESMDVMKLIAKIRDFGITVLLVEHDMNVVMNISDRIVVINFGKKITEGTPSEVSKNPEVIKAYLGGEASA